MPEQHENVKRTAVFIRIERAPLKSLWAKVGVTIFAVKILENYLIRMNANIKRQKQTKKQTNKTKKKKKSFVYSARILCQGMHNPA